MDKIIIKMPAVEGWQTKAKHSIVGAILDENGVKIVSVSGAHPEICQLLAALYASKDVRNSLKEFQSVEENNKKYRIKTDNKIMSEATDIFIEEAESKDGFDVIKRKFLMHITAFGKVNLQRSLKLSYREFIEVLDWYGFAEATPEELKKDFEFSYLKVRELERDFKAPTRLNI